jgi:raffinose/stachyose/melibiose transport system substrate-binding protein
MIRRRLTMVGAALVTLALTAAGCSTGSSTGSSSTTGSTTGGSGSSSSPSAAAATTSGNLSIYWQPDYKPNMDWLVSQFEKKYPNAHVKVTYPSQTQYFSLIRTQLAAGTAPDVFWATPGDGNPFAQSVLARAGYLADMSDAPWAKKLLPSIAPYSTFDGKTVSLPTNISAYGALYNETALKKEGLTAPQTWSQVLSFCAAAKSKGVQAYAMGASDLFFTQQFLFASVPTTVYKTDPKNDQQFAAKTTTFSNSPGWQQAMAKYEQANKAGCFGSSPAGTSFVTSVGDVAAGRDLGVIGAYLFASAITGVNPKADLQFSAFPIAPDPWLMVGAFGGAGVNAHAKDLGLAKTFVDFLGEPDIMAGYSKQGTGSLSTITGGPDIADNPGLKTISQYLAAGKTANFVDQTWPNADVQQAMYQSVQSMLAGKASPSDVLKAMTAAY